MSKRLALAPKTVDVILTLTGNSGPVTLNAFTNLQAHQYGGQPLFCHAQSNGEVLSILIDDVATSVLDGTNVLLAASSVDVTFVFNGKLVKNWGPSSIVYQGKQPLNFSAALDAGFTNLHFLVDDSPQVSSTAQHEGQVSFILVQQTPPKTDYTIHWITGDEIRIPDTDKISDGSIFLPGDPPPSTGGVPGPMGFSEP